MTSPASPALVSPTEGQHSYSPSDGASPVLRAVDKTSGFSVGLAQQPPLPLADSVGEQVFTSGHKSLAASGEGKKVKLCALNEQVKTQICMRVAWSCSYVSGLAHPMLGQGYV